MQRLGVSPLRTQALSSSSLYGEVILNGEQSMLAPYNAATASWLCMREHDVKEAGI